MKKVFPFLILFFSFASSYGQYESNDIDSLCQLGSSKVKYDIELSRECARIISEYPFLTYVQKAHLNYLCYRIEQREKELSPDKKEVNTDVENGLSQEGENLQKGVKLIEQGLVSEGLPLLFNYMENNNETITDSLRDYINIEIADGFRMNLEFQKAITLLVNVAGKQETNPGNRAYAYNRLAATYDVFPKLNYEQRFDSVRKYSLKAIKIAEDFGLKEVSAISQNELASLYSQDSRDLDTALYFAELAFNNFIEAGKFRRAMNNSIVLSGILIKKNKIEQALAPLYRVHDLLPFEGNIDLFFMLYLQLAKIHSLLRNYKKAYEFLSLSRFLQEKTFNISEYQKISELSAKYDLAVKEASIAEKKHQLLVQQNKIRMLFFLLSGSSLLLLFIILYITKWRQYIGQKAKLELAEKERLQVLIATQRQELEYKNSELARSIANNIEKNRILKNVKDEVTNGKSLDELIQLINSNIDTKQYWGKILFDFNNIYPHFTANIIFAHPCLSKNEVKLSILLQLKMTTSEIAQILSVSKAAVNKSRQRLRKKLELDIGKSILGYLMSLK